MRASISRENHDLPPEGLRLFLAGNRRGDSLLKSADRQGHAQPILAVGDSNISGKSDTEAIYQPYCEM
jgi:hypothetical protein